MGGGARSDSRPPSLALWLSEPLALPKIAAAPYRKAVPTLADGHGLPTIVLPGMASGDGSTALLRKSLGAAGFEPYASAFKSNLTMSPAKFEQVSALLDRAVNETGKPAVLVGWSLGGFYARVLAQRYPEKTAMVATLGTPFSGDRRANNAWRIYEMLADHKVDAPPLPDDPAIKPAAHTIAFWSPIDGIVAPASARGRDEERDEAIELPFRHFELGCSRRSVRMIVETLGERVARLGLA